MGMIKEGKFDIYFFIIKYFLFNLAVQNERPPRNKLVLYPRSSEQTNIISDSSLKTKQTEYDLINHLDDTISSQILLMIIKWIRNLPTFLNLPIDDQVFIDFSCIEKKTSSNVVSNNPLIPMNIYANIIFFSLAYFIRRNMG
jgi:hypothetical protein